MSLLTAGLELRFHPEEKDFPTWPRVADREKHEYPCFVNRGHHEFADGVKYRCIGYQFYFVHNRAIGLGGHREFSERLGYHRHDVEGVYVLFDRQTKEPCHVYYKAHGLGQGVWKLWEECPKTKDGALIVYFALNSHAAYSEPEDVSRIWGFANDRVAEGGRRVRIAKPNYVTAERIDFGDGILVHDRIPKISNTSISDAERVNLPLLGDRVRSRANEQYVSDDENDEL